MNPWQLIGRAQTPGGGAELVLYQRDSEFSLKADNLELMNSRVYGSEEAMARLGCQNLAKRPRARVLIGGLGMGYSVRTALDILGEDALVVVEMLGDADTLFETPCKPLRIVVGDTPEHGQHAEIPNQVTDTLGSETLLICESC